ncbi:MAG TPA: hypothetical protein VHK26_00135 [Methyloceanibacter sp.]|nr:hypothetical protein [Methyloceanibacter sp.]
MRGLAFIVGAMCLAALARNSVPRVDARGVSHARSAGSSPLKLPPVALPAVASGATALGTVAVGSLAVGALAIGALAVGALAVGALEIRKARLREVEIDDLVVHRFRVVEDPGEESRL